MHWCGGKLASIELFSLDNHHCPCGKKPMKPGCCKDKTTIIKVKNDLGKVSQIALKVSAPKLIFNSFKQNELLPSAQVQCKVSDFYHPPPNKPKVPIYLLDGVFLI